jgi:polyhydroxyalkanoate synthesis regulator phasin
MILNLAFPLISFLPLGVPTDALASMTQLELQLAEIQKLMNQNIELSKQNRESLTHLVDDLIAGANSALLNLEQSRAAHQDLLKLVQEKNLGDSKTSYDEEFQKRIENANLADSIAAEALQQVTHHSQKSSQFEAVDAQASVQVWQTLNRISMQLQELTSLMKKNGTTNLKLNRFESVLGIEKGSARRTRQ